MPDNKKVRSEEYKKAWKKKNAEVHRVSVDYPKEYYDKIFLPAVKKANVTAKKFVMEAVDEMISLVNESDYNPFSESESDS